MKRLLLLGLVPEGTGALPCPQPHLHLPAGTWEALVLELEADRQMDEAARMLDWATRQNAVLAAYIPLADVVPVALGAVFSRPAALQDHLAQQAGLLALAARAVAGRCEYVLQIRAEDEAAAPPAPVAPVASGGGFLRERQVRRDTRLHRTRDRHRFVQQVSTRIIPLVSCATPRDVTGKALLADLSLLVPRESVADLIDTLRAIAAEGSTLGLALRLIGPSPAYSFVNGIGPDQGAADPEYSHV